VAAKTKTAAGKQYDVEEARARAVAMYSDYIDAVDRIDELGIGTWIGMPPKMQKWHFVRCEKGIGRHMELAHMLQQQGYQIAPPGVRCVGFQDNPEHVAYLCCPPEIRKAVLMRKRRASVARANTLSDSFGGHMPSDAVVKTEKIG